MKLSVLIPTHNRPHAIDRCLAHLARQELGDGFEVIIGLDGPEDSTPDPSIPAGLVGCTRMIRYPRLGLIGVRRNLLEAADGEIVLWLNDDAYAAPGLLAAHLAAHADASDRVIAGRADWKPVAEPDLFDALVQGSDLIFFRQAADRPGPTGYRNCFGLNMSFPRALAQRAGGLHEARESYGYEDIELAYRMERAGGEIRYAPDAVVTHDHRYLPADVHRREYLLGRAAWHFAGLNPGFAQDLFRRDIRDEAELAYIERSLVIERRDAERIERSFLSLSDHAADAVDPALLPVLAEHWVPLKRSLWRWGVSDAARGIAPRWSLLCEETESAVTRHAAAVAGILES